VGALTAPHIHGTHVPVEEPSTASVADVGGCSGGRPVTLTSIPVSNKIFIFAS